MSETLREITSEMREINDEIEYLANLDLDTQQMEETLESLRKKMVRKIQNIDHIALGFEIAAKRLEVYAQFHESEAAIAKKQAEQMQKNKDRIYQMLIDLDIVAKNKPLKTDKHTYYLANHYGSVKIDDVESLPSEYVKTKIEQVIDKAALRKDLVDGKTIAGCSIERKERVSRK